MDTRPPPFQAHPRPSSRSHDFPQYNVPPSPYNPDGPRNIPPPPPPALHQDPFLRPQRQTFESIAASTPRPDTRQAPSYPPPPPPYTAPADAYYRDAHDRPPEAREGYGIKRSHDQAMAGDHSEPGRPDPRRLHYDLASAAAGHQHPPPFSHPQSHPSGASPNRPPNQHGPEHQKIGNGTMYQAPASRSPPPPSPYGSRPMPPPGSPQYAQPQYGPHGPPQGHLHLPPFGRDPGTSSHRSGSSMSLASMLGGDPPRPAQQEPWQGRMNGAPPNAQPHFQERESHRGGPPYLPPDARSQTPDRFTPRLYDYNRPSRAMSGGDRPAPMTDRSPEKYGFGPALPPNHHDSHVDYRGAPSSHPHNSAPGSRRQSIGGAFQHTMSRPQTSIGASGPDALLAASLIDSAERARREQEARDREHRDLRDPVRDAAGRSIPPPMPHPDDFRNGGPHGPPDRRAWEMDQGRPQYREDPGLPPKSASYPFAPNFQQSHQNVHEIYPPPEHAAQHQNGRLPLDGPAPRPLDQPPETERRIPFEGRKSSVDSVANQYQPRLESPLQRHRHPMDRTQSSRSELTPSRLLSVSNEDRRRAASPLPQAVQGASKPAKGPTSEPNIKNEFGRMFAGLGGVTPTPTPVELAHKRYSSPADEAPGGRSTPGLGRLDLGLKRANSRVGKRRKNKDDGTDGDLESPTAELTRSLSNKGVKRTRNSYIEGLGIQRGEAGSPFGAGRRAFTPNAFSIQKRDRKPRILVRSQAVLDAVKDLPRQHLGSMLYTLNIGPVRTANLYARDDSPEPGKYDFNSSPALLPRFEGKDNCTFTVRVSREHVSRAAREEVCMRRNLWGTEVYSDDTDPLAAAIHSGWIRGEWAASIDISMLSIGRQKEKEREERLNSNAIGPNGRTSLSVSVSPELSRKSLAPIPNGNGHGNTSGSDQGASRKNSDVGSGNEEERTQIDHLTSVPAYPVIPPAGKDVHITLLLLPRLQSYASTVQNGIKSRAWTTEHDGNSFMIHSIQFLEEGIAGRHSERGPAAKHVRLHRRAQQAKGIKRKLNNFSRISKNETGVVAAVGA